MVCSWTPRRASRRRGADEVTRGKPDPQGYLAAAKRLGVSRHDCVVIEDAPPGIAAANAAGMQSIGLATTHPPEALRDARAVASSLDALAVRITQSERGPRLALDVHATLSR